MQNAHGSRRQSREHTGTQATVMPQEMPLSPTTLSVLLRPRQPDTAPYQKEKSGSPSLDN